MKRAKKREKRPKGTKEGFMNVICGLDRVLSEPALLGKLKGRRVALLVNPTSITSQFVHAIDALQGAGVNVVRLFGPEHGVRGEAQDMEAVGEPYDPITGLPTVSLYGHTYESLKPTLQDLDGVDLLLADIQDIGARYYTYVYTIGLTMQACGEAGVEVWVLDRPNPIGGEVVEGNVLLPEYKSFVGMQPLAVRHGMTAGELAQFFLRYCGWSCELKVISMLGWKRSMFFDETGLPWVMPSPNMPTLDTAIVYPGQCLLEGTNASEGRGTTRPFELFGAPYVDARQLRDALEAYKFDGVRFREVSFRPKFQKFGDQTCSGVQVHVTDRRAFRSLTMSMAILCELWRLYAPDFSWREEAYEFVKDRLAIDLLLGDIVLRKGIEDGQDPRDLVNATGTSRLEFDERRASCLLYDQ